MDGSEITVGTDVVEIPSSETDAEYSVNMGYSTDDTHNFEGWLVSDGSANFVDPANPAADRLFENGNEITIKGDVKFTVSAPEGHWLVFDENGKGATYNAPRFVKAGETTSNEGMLPMERKGYTFDGWYTGAPSETGADPTGTVFQFGGQLSDTTTVYAKWLPNTEAGYTVIFWTQNQARTGYDVADSYVRTNGTVGQNIPYTVRENGAEDYVERSGAGYDFGTHKDEHGRNQDNGHYTGFCLREDSKNQQVVITPEGDAVLNLYYDRIEYNFKFYVYRSGDRANRYDVALNSGSGSNLNDLVTWHSNDREDLRGTAGDRV